MARTAQAQEIDLDFTVLEENQAQSSLASLKQRVAWMVESWRELQSNVWDVDAAIVQYEEIERITTEAERLKLTDILEHSVALAAFLCPLIEKRHIPSDTERSQLNRMIELLHFSANHMHAACKSAATEHLVKILYVRPNGAELKNLFAEFGQHQYQVHCCDDMNEARALAQALVPDAVVVEKAFVPEVAGLVEQVEKSRVEAKGRAVFLVVGDHIDVASRLFAQRAGIDEIIVSHDASYICERLKELLAVQHHVNYRVLVVEDDRGQALFCETVLKHRGIEVHVCLVPDGVIDAIAAFKPDLVLLDLYLPGTNGIEIAQLIREKPEWLFLPIIFLSGETDLDKRFDAIRMGGDDFITKPVKPRHLISTVEARVRRARQNAPRQAGAIFDRRGHLASRQTFLKALSQALENSTFQPVALAMVALAREESFIDQLGLAGTFDVANQMVNVLSSKLAFARPLCAFGELRYLALIKADSEEALRGQLQNVRETLETHHWVAEEQQFKLSFVVAAIKLQDGTETAEGMIKKLRHLARGAIVQGGGVVFEVPKANTGSVVQEDPVLRLTRTLLRGPAIPDTIRAQYQAIIPLAAGVADNYATRFDLMAPKASKSLLVPSEQLRAIARDLHAVTTADRYCLRTALAILADHLKSNKPIKLFVPVSIESFLDVAFAPWLAAELNARGLPPSMIVIELDHEEALGEIQTLPGALDAIQLVETPLCLRGFEQNHETGPFFTHHPAFCFVKLVLPETEQIPFDKWLRDQQHAIQEMKNHQKQVIVQGVREIKEINELMKGGVHYLQSDAFAAWEERADFDFSDMQL